LRARIVTHASDNVASVAFCGAPEAAAGTSASTGGFSNGAGLISFLVYANIVLRQTRPLSFDAFQFQVPAVIWKSTRRLCDNTRKIFISASP
jgi:hypothetical protein